VPDAINGGCNRSFIPDHDSSKIPCLLTASYLIVSIFSGLTGLYVYIYLQKNIEKDILELLSGDLGHTLKEEVNKLSSMFAGIVIVVLVTLAATYSYFTLAAMSSEDPSPSFVFFIGSAGQFWI
jgi:hypothetical protein